MPLSSSLLTSPRTASLAPPALDLTRSRGRHALVQGGGEFAGYVARNGPPHGGVM